MRFNQARIEGGRFIDTTELPKLGYISATPELTITRLESVTADISQRREVMIDGNGKRTILPDQNQPAIIIKVPKAEASQFTSLTKRAVGKQLLIALGERPLAAPMVLSPILTQTLTLTSGNRTDRHDLLTELKQLVK